MNTPKNSEALPPTTGSARLVGRSPVQVPSVGNGIKPCCSGKAEIIASLITRFNRSPHYEVMCAHCGQSFEGVNIFAALKAWNENKAPKIVQFNSQNA